MQMQYDTFSRFCRLLGIRYNLTKVIAHDDCPKYLPNDSEKVLSSPDVEKKLEIPSSLNKILRAFSIQKIQFHEN